jgi:DNA modification methylase/transposase-like protein
VSESENMMHNDIELCEISLDQDFYPRSQVNQKKVNEYIEALKSGNSFPPITLQKVKYPDGTTKLVLLDGAHRTEAYKQFNKWLISNHNNDESEISEPIEKIHYVLHSDKVYFKEVPSDRADLLLIAAKYNSAHGYQMSNDDKKRTARAICELDPSRTDAEIAKGLGVPRTTLNDWVRDIKHKHEASQQSIITRLDLLGWTQQDIGNVVGLTRPRVEQVLIEMTKSSKLSQSLKDLLGRGNSIHEVSKSLGLDPILAWALLLKDETDINRLKKLENENDGLNCSPRPYDTWNFSGSYPLFGTEGYPGQIVLQLLYFYTKPGDLVIDPMAGGGTTIDACLVMGRRCLAFDSEPMTCAARKDIRQKDALDAIKELTRRADLIFLDSPYFKKLDKNYGDNSISRLGRKEYLKFFSDFAKISYEKLNRGGRVALLMSDYIDGKNPEGDIFIDEYITRQQDSESNESFHAIYRHNKFTQIILSNS